MKTLIISLSIGFLLIGGINAQDTTKTCSPKFDVQIKNIESFNMLYYEFTGPYEQAYNSFQTLMDFMAQNNIGMGSSAVGIYYDDPQVVAADKLRSEVGYTTINAVDSAGNFKFKKVEAYKAVCVKYTSMADMMGAYGAIMEYITKNNITIIGPAYEFYYDMYGPNPISEIAFPIAQ